MADVIPIRRIADALAGDKMGEPPYDGGMETRVAKLETLTEKTGERFNAVDVKLTKIEAQIESITKFYATKADVVEAKNSIIMWVVSAILLAQLLPAILKKFGL